MKGSRHGSARSDGGSRDASRSTREWIVRIAVAVVAIALGYLSVVTTLANVVVKVDPGNAIALNPRDGRILAAFAQQRFTTTPDASPGSEAVRLANQALRRDPTAVEALTVLGLRAQLQSEDDVADQVFRYSVWLSRRELQPQIWAIEKAVARGDIKEALRNYDIALRTSPRARDILFPILGSAVADPKIRSSLVPILTLDPIWAQPFVRYAANRSSDSSAVASLFRAVEAKGFPIDADDKALLVKNLVSKNLMDEAWDYYTTFRPAVVRNKSRDPNFELDARVRTPFDWNLRDTPGLSVAMLQEKGGGVVDFAVAPSTGATVMAQVQLLPPGDYRLSWRSRGIDQPARSRPYWLLTCLSGQELARIELQNLAESEGKSSGEFNVPATCSVQMLSLVLRASDDIAGITGQIEKSQILPRS